MKVLLTALNSKYIHTNLAVRYLKEYAAQHGYGCEIAEYTINQHLPDILEVSTAARRTSCCCPATSGTSA